MMKGASWQLYKIQRKRGKHFLFRVGGGLLHLFRPIDLLNMSTEEV